MQVDYPKMAAALGIQENVLRETLLSVSRASGHEVAFEVLCKALKEGFEKTFGVRLRVCDFSKICDFPRKIASYETVIL